MIECLKRTKTNKITYKQKLKFWIVQVLILKQIHSFFKITNSDNESNFTKQQFKKMSQRTAKC